MGRWRLGRMSLAGYRPWSYHECMGQIKGFESALEALRMLDSKAQNRILDDILKQDPQMAHRLKSHLVQFDDLLQINPQGLVQLLQAVPDARWVLALRGKTVDFVDKLLAPLAKRKSDLYKAALTQLGPQPAEKVDGAQREIIKKALELEAQGLLLFTRGNDPLV